MAGSRSFPCSTAWAKYEGKSLLWIRRREMGRTILAPWNKPWHLPARAVCCAQPRPPGSRYRTSTLQSAGQLSLRCSCSCRRPQRRGAAEERRAAGRARHRTVPARRARTGWVYVSLHEVLPMLRGAQTPLYVLIRWRFWIITEHSHTILGHAEQTAEAALAPLIDSSRHQTCR